MPTTKRRYPVTETPEVSEALHAAARRWPEDRDKPARLLRHLIEEGFKSIERIGKARPKNGPKLRERHSIPGCGGTFISRCFRSGNK